ncbi:hypothetical protein BC834DRAFT_832002 [Gloeopeniophorella convolvens]|nr:hypothetical protein BC834DRAFT_832002 [Gloeopeniophorella convolvens]
MSYGSFLHEFFRDDVDLDTLHGHKLQSFLSGKNSHNAADTVNMIWHHRYSHASERTHESHADYFSPSKSHKDIKFAGPAIATWCLRRVIEQTEQEAKYLCSQKAGLRIRAGKASAGKQSANPYVSWDLVRQFSMAKLTKKYQHNAPVTWKILRDFVDAGVGEDSENDEDADSLYRPKDLVSVSKLLMFMVFTRNSRVNLLPLCRGLTLFASKAHQATYRIGSRFAQNVPYATVYAALITMSKVERVSRNHLFKEPKPSLLVMDNVQVQANRRELGTGVTDKMLTGTAATVIQMEGCTWGDLLLRLFLENIKKEERAELTITDVQGKIDTDHIATVFRFHFIETLVTYIPQLLHLRQPVSKLFKEAAQRHQIDPHRHTVVYPLGMNSENEVSTRGVKEAVCDFLNQIGCTAETSEGRAMFISGDGKTFEGLHTAKNILSGIEDDFRSLRFARPVLELWHTKWTDMNRIFEGFWGGDLARVDPSTLGFMALLTGTIKPTAESDKTDYYKGTRTIGLVVQGHILDCWRCRDQFTLLDHFEKLGREDRLPSLTALLQDADILATRYASEAAYLRAMDPASEHPDCLHSVPRNLSWREEADRAQWPLADEDSAAQGADMLPEDADNPISFHDGPFLGDHALANSTLFIRSGVLYLEVVRAVSLGDAGRVWEVLKIWLFSFAGSGHNRYSQYLVEMFCNLELEYPEPMRRALFENWLVNRTGKPGHFLEIDLMQEHFNHWLAQLAQHKGKEYDHPWYREILSLQVDSILHITREMEQNARLEARRKAHTSPHLNFELIEIMKSCKKFQLHVRCDGRDFGFHAKDHFSAGIDVLGDGKLGEFVKKGVREHTNMTEELQMPEGYEDPTVYLDPAITFEDGQSMW